MKLRLLWRRPVRPRQFVFAFLDRSVRRERLFKRVILLTTCLVIVLISRVVPRGRDLAATIEATARQAARGALGFPKSRAELDETWRRYRLLQIELTRPNAVRLYHESESRYQRVMQYAGLDPAHMLLRWGNYNWTLLLSSKVFEVDDEGRSFRMRPLTRSIWLMDFPLPRFFPVFFLVPDGPGLTEAIRETEAKPLETSRQTTNSWGVRGPEPDLDAPLRGIVLGDSFMQGMFIGDDETPPECLRRDLQDHLKSRVSVLNAGVMGYGPEQYYYSLVAFGARFRPQFVVVSVSPNDFGGILEVATRDGGDWKEGRYWLEKIFAYCQARQWTYLVVPVPLEQSLSGKRNTGYYPGVLSRVLQVDSLMFLDPIDDFADAYLELLIAGGRTGRRPRGCPLFNVVIDDGHFSAAGSRVWAASVGRRLVLLMERDRVIRDQVAARPEKSP